MRIVVHDYSGHPGQVQLSRVLAGRGHTVIHQFCPSYTTGNGSVVVLPGDPSTFSVEGVSLKQSFARYTIIRRVGQELQYGRLAANAIGRHQPDVALLSNIPLLSLLVATLILRRAKIPVVFWQQDVYSAAIRSTAKRKLGRIGGIFGYAAVAIERYVARHSAAVVPIDESFTDVLHGWGVTDDHVTVIPNWAPIDELPEKPHDRAWAIAHGAADLPIVLYTGTLGFKHDPSLLADAAAALAGTAQVIVVSEGLGRAILDAEKAKRHLDNLLLLDFQPYADLPEIMATADVLVAVLEPEASIYSVPSKVLTYLCAGRPIVAVIPTENSVARIITSHDAGRIVAPGDLASLIETLRSLLADAAQCEKLGANARSYAEATFTPDAVADRFESVLAGTHR